MKRWDGMQTKPGAAAWNLAVSLALLAACGHEADTSEDRPPGEVDGDDEYGDDCIEDCCDGDCEPFDPEPEPDPECYEDADCAAGYVCEADACAPRPVAACETQPTITEVPLLDTTEALALGFVEASAAPGRELLVAIGDGIRLIASDGSDTLVALLVASQVAAADLDGDGDEDVAALVFDPEPSLHVVLADGLGGWAVGPGTPIGTFFGLGDFDGDGIVDVASGGSVRVTWRRGVGDGTFSEELAILEGSNQGVVAIAPSGDSANADVIVAAATVSYGAGASGLALQPLAPAVAGGPFGIASGDYDGDGATDVTVITASPGSSRLIQTWRGVASSTTALAPWALDALVSYASADDLDADGLDDVLLAASDGQLVMRHGTATGGDDPLGCVARAAVPSQYIYQFALGDFDGDGRADPIVATNSGIMRLRLQ